MKEALPQPLLVIVGPTGTGKSELACRCAERFGGEVIGFDSIQVYRGLEAGTAKPPPAIRRRIRHHLIDIAGPERDFSLGEFVRAAEAAVTQVRGRGALPILAGGTGLYLQGFLNGILPLPARRAGLRARLDRSARRRGVEHLHRMLRRLDPDSAARVAPRDRQRLVRALEIRLETGAAWSAHLRRRGSRQERFPNVKIGLQVDRETLFGRLDRRVEEFYRAGLVDEVRRLLAAGCPPEANALKAIGYREALRHLRGECTEEEALRETKRSTRQFARRQATWFRKTPNVRWFPVDAGIDAAWTGISAFLAEVLETGDSAARP